MLINYLTIAWRNLLKNKVFAVINILGLAMGISVCFIIVLFVQDELSYDRFNEKAGRIARVEFKATIYGGMIREASVMPPVATALKNDYPEVEEATRLRSNGSAKIRVGNKVFQQAVAFVDADFFNVFTLPLIQGDAATALARPNTLVITGALAKKYLGTQNAMGKVLYFADGDIPYTITGIVDKMPSNAHFHFELFASLAGNPEAGSNSWLTSNFYTYLLLKEGASISSLEARLPATVEKYMGPQILESMGMNLDQFRTRGNELGFKLQPLTDIHLFGDNTNELEPGGDIRYVYIFGAIAIFVLLLAMINFVNLSTAAAAGRAKEVGVRKVLGSGIAALVKQFLSESLLLSAVALLVSIVLLQLALPFFNQLSGKQLTIGVAFQPLLLLVSLGLCTGLLAGVYPAFFLAAFQPVHALKGRNNSGNSGAGVRKGLVVFQFFIAAFMMVGTLVVYQQLKFIQDKKLGYNRAQMVILPNSYALGEKEKVFKQDLLNDPQVVNVTVSGYKPAGPTFSNNFLVYPEGNEQQMMRTLRYKVDEQYIPTLGIEMAEGRNFSAGQHGDSNAVILNETAVQAFGFGDQAIGKKISWVSDQAGTRSSYEVVGVVKDFHFKSLHQAITPLLMVLEPETGLIIKVKTGDLAGFLTSLQQQWRKFNTNEPFTYQLMDDLYNNTYAAERRTGKLVAIFACLTILVACLGLFGLATYTAEQRRREIGIRKVLGASVNSLLVLLSKDFLKLVLLAAVIAFPIAWYLMNKWLENFAYRINISWWVFIAAGSCAATIALFTISFQTIKASLTNPVKNLRTE